MRNIISFVLLVSYIFTHEGHIHKDSGISFNYGLLSKPSYESGPNEILSDSSKINTGDFLRINIGYSANTDLCIIYKGANGEYLLLDSKESDPNATDKIIYYTALHPTEMGPPVGFETFYFINSRSSLTDLIMLLNRYENVPPKGKKKVLAKLEKKINSFNPDTKSELTSFSTKLEKPVAGGVAFRGEDDEVKDLSLTHECHGENGVAFKKIVLIHE